MAMKKLWKSEVCPFLQPIPLQLLSVALDAGMIRCGESNAYQDTISYSCSKVGEKCIHYLVHYYRSRYEYGIPSTMQVLYRFFCETALGDQIMESYQIP